MKPLPPEPLELSHVSWCSLSVGLSFLNGADCMAPVAATFLYIMLKVDVFCVDRQGQSGDVSHQSEKIVKVDILEQVFNLFSDVHVGRHSKN